MTALQEIISKLPLLSGKDLDALAANIKAFRSNSANKISQPEADFILDVIGRVMVDHQHPQNSLVLRRSSSYSSFLQKVHPLMKFLHSVTGNRLEQSMLLTIALNLLYQDISKNRVITSIMIMNMIHLVPPTLDKHFPGYARAGLLGMLIKQQGTTNGQAR